MKFSTLEKPKPTWKVPVAFSFTSTVTITFESSLPGLCCTSTVSKKPSGGPRAFAAALPGSREKLALVRPHLPADRLVARLGVAADVNPLDVDLVPFLNVEGEVDQPLLGVQLRQRGDVGVGVTLVQIEVGQRGDVVGQLGAVEQLALARGHQAFQRRLCDKQVAGEVELTDGVCLALLDLDADVDVALVR